MMQEELGSSQGQPAWAHVPRVCGEQQQGAQGEKVGPCKHFSSSSHRLSGCLEAVDSAPGQPCSFWAYLLSFLDNLGPGPNRCPPTRDTVPQLYGLLRNTCGTPHQAVTL